MAQIEYNLRVAVIGTGRMGQNHVRVYSNMKNVELVGIYDTNRETALKIAKQYNCTILNGVEDAIDKVDAVSICTPSTSHIDHGLFFLENRISCLIEKPLATTQEDCLALIAAAKKSNSVLMTGHIERFNPAVQILSKILSAGNHKIHAIDTARMSMTDNRNTDVNVVMDLMVHDIDVVLFLVGEQPVNVNANSTSAPASKVADYVNALLTFKNGSIAKLTASRMTHNKIRKLNISASFGFIELDYINQDLHIFHQEKDIHIGPDDTYTLDIASERVLVRRAEPLLLELQNFRESVLGRVKPIVTGTDGLAALQIVQQIQSLIGDKK